MTTLDTDGLATLRLAPHVAAHIHWVLCQHGLDLVHKLRAARGDKYQQLLSESQLNGVALAQFTQLVKRGTTVAPSFSQHSDPSVSVTRVQVGAA